MNSAVNVKSGKELLFVADANGNFFSFEVDGLVTNVDDAGKIDDIGPVYADEAGRRQLGEDRLHRHSYQ